MLFLILGSIIGMFGVVSNKFFTILPQTQFQVTETAKVLFSSEPVSSGETDLFIFLVISAQAGLILWFVKKLKLPVFAYFMFLLLFIVPLVAIEWIGMHRIIYGALEDKLLAVGVFGAVGTLITILTGSFIPWWAIHFTNNLFGGIKESVGSNELIVVYTLFSLVILVVIWGGVEYTFYKIRKGKKINQDVYEVPEVKNV